MELRHTGFGNVVSLFGKSLPLTYQAISQVDAYWEGLRDGRLMPDRAEIDPRGIGTALEFAFVLEHVAPGVARVRISGMHMRDLLGMEVRGMPLTAFFIPESRERIARVLDSVVNGPQVAELSLSGERGIGKPTLPARLYLAPLSNQGGRGHPRILGCLESHGEIGRSPRRFVVEDVHMRRIIATAGSSETQAPDKPDVAASEPAAGFAEPPATFTPASQKAPHLRLVHDQD